MDFGPTLDVSDIVEEENSEGIENDTRESWGRLFSLGKGLTGLELTDDEYTFGRSDDCSYCFEFNGGRKNSHFKTFSNTHFRVYREIDKNDNTKYVVFLQDKSTNGTFINGEKIGKNKISVLNNDDEISLSVKKNKVFVFNDKSCSNNNDKLPPEFTEKYTMSRLLGRGACGEVKLAFEKETCEKYAVKIISKKTFSVGPQLNRAAMEEVRIIKSMDHPCIIRVEDLYDTPSALLIVLELVEGGELFDRVISVGKFSEEIAKVLFYQMLVAVKYLHDRGITHRDLKPENILLASDDEVTLIKVTDFGLSKFVGEQSLMKTLCGTPNYLAPEILKSAGMGGYNKVVDCWSLGVILFIMLGGYPPFSKDIKEYELEDQICNARYSFPDCYWKDISADAKDLISKLLVVESSKRLSTAEALEHPWMKDPNIISKATALMNDAANKHNMPPPSTPGVKRPSDDGDTNCKRFCIDTTLLESANEDMSDGTDMIRYSSVASTVSNYSTSPGNGNSSS